MAATKRNAMNMEQHRQKIATDRLIARLSNHVLRGTKMEKTQVSAAIALLRKTVPDLQSVEMDVSGDVTQRVVSEKPMSPEDWEQKYADDLNGTQTLN